MPPTNESTQDELNRRHRSAVRVILAALALAVVLMLVSVTGLAGEADSYNPISSGVLRITLVVLGLGAIFFRRTRFNPMRLQDIASLRGASGLLKTLESTTVYVALIAAAIAAIGFALAWMSGAAGDSWLGVIAIAVLFYAYPRRAVARVVEATRGGRCGVREPAAKGTSREALLSNPSD